MPIRVNMPDGSVVNFPDGMPTEQIASEMARLSPTKPDFTSTNEPPAESLLAQAGGFVKDVGVGVLQGAGQTAVNLGRLVHKVPGVSAAVDALYGTPGLSNNAFPEADRVLTPQTAGQSVGKGLEQIGEFFIPAGATAKAGAAATARYGPRLGRAMQALMEGGAAGGVATAQGADPTTAGVAGVLGGAPTALAPVGRRLTASIAERLQAQAAKRVTEGLSATRNNLKLEAKRIAPEFAKRGLGGKVEALAEEAGEQTATIGRQIGAAIKGPAGQQRVPTAPVVQALEAAKGKLTTTQVQTGASIVTDKAQHKALGELQDVVKEYGDEMSVEQVNALKRLYSRVTANRGGYDVKAGEILNTAPEAARTFAAILRKTENGTQAIADLNKEFRFWKGLERVAQATVNRRTSQGRGLTATIAPLIGGATGFASGDSLTDRAGQAFVGAAMSRQLTKALMSPQWKFVRARYATRLAEALAHGNQERIGQVVGKVLAAEATATK